jgi:hypothetical protein
MKDAIPVELINEWSLDDHGLTGPELALIRFLHIAAEDSAVVRLLLSPDINAFQSIPEPASTARG